MHDFGSKVGVAKCQKVRSELTSSRSFNLTQPKNANVV